MNYLQIPSTPVMGAWLWGPPSRRDTSSPALGLLHGPLRSIVNRLRPLLRRDGLGLEPCQTQRRMRCQRDLRPFLLLFLIYYNPREEVRQRCARRPSASGTHQKAAMVFYAFSRSVCAGAWAVWSNARDDIAQTAWSYPIGPHRVRGKRVFEHNNRSTAVALISHTPRR